MFRRVPISRLGAYSLFMIRNKAHPDLKTLPVAERGRKTAELYHALSASQLQQLKADAAKIPSKSKAAKSKATTATGKRKPGPYAQFVKDNFHKVKDLPFRDRMKTLAGLYKNQK